MTALRVRFTRLAANSPAGWPQFRVDFYDVAGGFLRVGPEGPRPSTEGR